MCTQILEDRTTENLKIQFWCSPSDSLHVTGVRLVMPCDGASYPFPSILTPCLEAQEHEHWSA